MKNKEINLCINSTLGGNERKSKIVKRNVRDLRVFSWKPIPSLFMPMKFCDREENMENIIKNGKSLFPPLFPILNFPKIWSGSKNDLALEQKDSEKLLTLVSQVRGHLKALTEKSLKGSISAFYRSKNSRWNDE